MIPIYREPWSRPISINESSINESFSPSVCQYDYILLRIESSDPLTWGEKAFYRYTCLTCYAASGNLDVFSTSWRTPTEMEEGPTAQQVEEIRDHAKQHSIMYSWAKGLK